MSIHSQLPFDQSTSHARIPAGGINLIASIDSFSEAQFTASFFGSTKALHGEVATTSPATTTHNHSNQQYSINAITTSTGTVAERYAYSAYGEPTILDGSGAALGSSSINNRYSYTGREWDATVGLYHFRARWMSPKTGRFLGRDPIGYIDGSNLYKSQLLLANVDPSGNCKVELVCTNLVPYREHCGIEVTDGGGKKYYHVVSPGAGILSNDTCDVRDTGPGRIDTPIGVGPWRVVDTWMDPSGTLCGCMHRMATLIRSKKLTYWPTPGNTVTGLPPNCSSTTTCNSNYTSHCMMAKCGIDSKKNTGRKAPGWDHRMQKCVKFGSSAGMVCSECACEKWKNIDDEWCSDPPATPIITPEPR